MTTIRTLYQTLLEYGSKFNEVPFTPALLTKVLRRFVGSKDITVKMERSNLIDENQIVIGGLYDQEEDIDSSSSITVYITFNKNQQKILIKDIEWNNVCIDLIECIAHETVHQSQYRRRNFDCCSGMFVSTTDDDELREEQNYLGHPDEIEAYGCSIAIWIYLKYNIKRLHGTYIFRSPIYKSYSFAFGDQHPIVASLKEHAITYYAYLRGETNVEKSKQLN